MDFGNRPAGKQPSILLGVRVASGPRVGPCFTSTVRKIMWNPGKLVIIGIFAVALASVAVSTWYHYQGARRPIESWGSPNAVLIAQAPRIEALKLRRPSSSASPQMKDVPAEAQPGQSTASDQPRERLVVDSHAYEVLESK